MYVLICIFISTYNICVLYVPTCKSAHVVTRSIQEAMPTRNRIRFGCGSMRSCVYVSKRDSAGKVFQWAVAGGVVVVVLWRAVSPPLVSWEHEIQSILTVLLQTRYQPLGWSYGYI